MPHTFSLDNEAPHYRWNNAIPPRLTIDPGDTVVFQTRDAADGQVTATTTLDEFRQRQFRGHPLTGPVAIRGAEPGDGLVIAVIEVKPAPYGWTAIYPGRALIGADFDEPFIQIWDLTKGDHATLTPGVSVPLAPFCGQMGVAPAEAGEHGTGPPRRVGGNLDVRQLVAGSTLYLPIECAGGLFSVGDCHAAQGDGEVCLTGIEMAATVTLRFGLRKQVNWASPRYETTWTTHPSLEGRGWFATTGIGPDLYLASQAAIREMVAYLAGERGLSREQAYVLCSVAVDLRISEIVDAPNWVVSALLPLGIFG